jgi:hypothetical protein
MIPGNEITKNGIDDELHERLNNHIVLKSIFYAINDTLLLDFYPR